MVDFPQHIANVDQVLFFPLNISCFPQFFSPLFFPQPLRFHLLDPQLFLLDDSVPPEQLELVLVLLHVILVLLLNEGQILKRGVRVE